jgi:uracil-DNA glycosylase family 4
MHAYFNFRGRPQSKGAHLKVQDCGPPDADIMLIGEAPGEHEERQGVPFVGPAGKMLKQMLSHSGINYNNCYVTNVMDFRPPDNNFSYFYDRCQPTPRLEEAWSRLQNKVKAVNPKVVIPLGAEPLRALCNKTGIGEYRGTWLSFRGISVLPTYHPSYILRVYNEHPICELDFRKAVSQEPCDNPPMVLRPDLQQVLSWCTRLNKDGCFEHRMNKATGTSEQFGRRISFDIETIGKHVRCLGFYDGRTAICIPFIKFASSNLATVNTASSIIPVAMSSGAPGSYWSPQEEVAVLNAIDELFRSGIEVVGQNSICFDEPLLQAEFGLDITNHYMDTMHAWHVLYPEFPKSLSFLCSVLTNYRNYWTTHDSSDDISEWTYNCMDCVVTWDVSWKIEHELREVTV